MDDYQDKSAEELVDDLKEIMDVLNRKFRQKGGLTYQRWKSYPYGHIMMALTDDHEYLGKNTFTVERLVKDLDSDSDGDDAEDSDEE